MNDTEARSLLSSLVDEVAPGSDLEALASDELLTEALDLDSMDFLALVTFLYERTGLDVPERDYPHLATADSFAAYLVAHA